MAIGNVCMAIGNDYLATKGIRMAIESFGLDVGGWAIVLINL